MGVAAAPPHTGTQLVELSPTDKDYIAVAEEVPPTHMYCSYMYMYCSDHKYRVRPCT